jgi:hypothetical protein
MRRFNIIKVLEIALQGKELKSSDFVQDTQQIKKPLSWLFYLL